MGVLFHLSLTVLFTISDSRVFSLTRWSSWIHKGFLVSQATRENLKKKRKKRDFHPLWCRFQLLKIFLFSDSLSKGSTKRYLFSHNPVFQFRQVPFRSPLLRKWLLLFFPLVNKMFQFTKFFRTDL